MKTLSVGATCAFMRHKVKRKTLFPHLLVLSISALADVRCTKSKMSGWSKALHGTASHHNQITRLIAPTELSTQ